MHKSVYVDVDGETVFKWDRPAKYSRNHLFAYRLPIDTDGKHIIRVYSPEEKGGLVGKSTKLFRVDR